jgi:hypothetical protein
MHYKVCLGHTSKAWYGKEKWQAAFVYDGGKNVVGQTWTR